MNLVDLPPNLPVKEAVQRYEASADVEYAEPIFLNHPSGKPLRSGTGAPNDDYFDRLWGLNNIGQAIGGQTGTSDADVDGLEAWSTTTSTSTSQTGAQNTSGAVVAVIDEGVDIDHPDFDANIWTNQDEIPGNGRDDDSNGYVDDVHGYDFANDDAIIYDPDPVNGRGEEHGTHVAGTIAAEGDNRIGVIGVSPEARIMVLKVLNPGGGTTEDAIEAINYAVDNGVKVSNNSWGYTGPRARASRGPSPGPTPPDTSS